MPAGWIMQPPATVLRFLAEAQIEAAQAVRGAIARDRRGRRHRRRSLAGGGRLAYAAAGSSGLMALADALELPGTFGIPRDRIVMLLAGGGRSARQSCRRRPRTTPRRPRGDVADAGLGKGDCLIAVSASGTTPYAVGALEEASAARREDHRHRQQCRRAAARTGRVADPARHAARAHRRLDPHGRRHGAEDRAQHAVDAGGDPSRPCA